MDKEHHPKWYCNGMRRISNPKNGQSKSQTLSYPCAIDTLSQIPSYYQSPRPAIGAICHKWLPKLIILQRTVFISWPTLLLVIESTKGNREHSWINWIWIRTISWVLQELAAEVWECGAAGVVLLGSEQFFGMLQVLIAGFWEYRSAKLVLLESERYAGIQQELITEVWECRADMIVLLGFGRSVEMLQKLTAEVCECSSKCSCSLCRCCCRCYM